MKKLSGAQIIIESLIAEGVDVIFGYPGGAILPTYDALLDSKIRHVLVRHEQGAAHMAEGYARVSGRPGVVMVTSGPGATNTVTGIADAYMDSTPMVVISGQVLHYDDWQRRFPGGRFRRHYAPCTKHNYLVKDIKRPRPHHQGGLLYRGHRPPGSGAGRRAQGCAAGRARFQVSRPGRIARLQAEPKGNPRQIERAVDAIEKSDKPLFYVGGGVQWSGAAPELTQLARGTGYPGDRNPDGPGVVPSLRFAVPGDARDARLVRHQHGGLQHRLPDCGRRALRRPRHRAHRGFRAARPRPSSISISTRRRFPRMSKSMCRSSAISSRCWPTCWRSSRGARGSAKRRADVGEMASADSPVAEGKAALREWHRNGRRAVSPHARDRGDCTT